MKELLYLNKHMALINFSKSYYTTTDELISSDSFDLFLSAFLKDYELSHPRMYRWLVQDLPLNEVKKDLKRLMKVLMVLDRDEVQHPLIKESDKLLQVVEDAYRFWRNMQRYSLIHTKNREGLEHSNFIEADNTYNQMILNMYRTIQQKVQGSKNRVYRQLQAGTNASFFLNRYEWNIPAEYEQLRSIPFINKILLRTPLIIHTKSNKRHGMFTQALTNPIFEFVNSNDEWFCFPCRVGKLLTFFYFHRDYTPSAVALSNLFELAAESECVGHKPDCIVLFGNPDGKKDTTFYHDVKHDIWVGKVSYDDVIHYFGYTKKMCLTLHNLCVMEKGWLPLHGAMINLHMKDGSKKGLVFIGDSGAGKSETIEALSAVAKDEILYSEVVFDDMGSMHLVNDQLKAQGTEIGAFVRLDDLDKGTAYRDIDRSVFFNPENMNARIVIPAAPYKVVVEDHDIDMVIYANNYDDKRGLKRFTDREEAKKTFLEGKRFALGTTSENGLSSTFFANPFGPMQKQAQCYPIFNQMFDAMFDKDIFVGEIYTCLGLPNKGEDGLKIAARELLEEIKK
ncbi:MAG: hypothetical protein IKU28_00980 [Erysipelotrichaceae bacterium]|nr:hypothetical protein [Erysipelotrichaceae bacterium]